MSFVDFFFKRGTIVRLAKANVLLKYWILPSATEFGFKDVAIYRCFSGAMKRPSWDYTIV